MIGGKQYTSPRNRPRVHAVLIAGGIVSSAVAVVFTELALTGKVFQIAPHVVFSNFALVLVALVFAQFSFVSVERIPGSTPRFVAIPTVATFYFLLISTLVFF